jgi:tetratricopeptide (TPR) repeat protein
VVVLLLAALAFQPAPAMLRALFEEELARVTSRHGASDVRTGRAARDLGVFAARQGDAAGARAALAIAVRADEVAFGPSDPQTLADVAELAAVSEAADAVRLWERASASRDGAVSARAFAALGDLRHQAGDFRGAIRLYRSALAREEAAAERNELRIAARLNTLSLLLDPADAVPLLERALGIVARRIGRQTVEAASIEINLAVRLEAIGKRASATQTAGSAVTIFEETLGAEHPRTVESRAYLRRLTGANGSAGK